MTPNAGRTPTSAPDPQVRLLISTKADVGDGCGPGGPPHCSQLPASPPAAAFAPALTPAAAATAMSLAWHHRTSFVHHHGPAHKVPAIASLNSVVRSGVIVDLNECKAACFSSKSIAHYVDTVYSDSCLRKEIGYIGLSRRIGEGPDE